MGLVSVIVDSREPEWVQALTFGGVPAIVSALDAGDLLLACDDGALVVVERKTASDFLNTLRDDRLFPQIAKLREQTQWSYLVVCGDLRPGPGGVCYCDGKETGWNWSSVSGALITAQELGVHVVQLAGDHDYEAAVIRLACRDRQTVRVQPARDLSIVSEAERILAALPGIGPERIAAVLEFCGTPAWALTWLTDDRQLNDGTVPGIGLRTKQRIRKALGLDAETYMSVIVKDTNQEAERKQEAAA